MAASAQSTNPTPFVHSFDRSAQRTATTFPFPRSLRLSRPVVEARLDIPPTGSLESLADFSPANSVQRRIVSARGIVVEFVEGAGKTPLKSQIKAFGPVLIAYERGLRGGGGTTVAGLPESSVRDLTHKLSFVPTGHEYRERHEPLFDLSAIYIYFDVSGLNDPTGLTSSDSWSPPRLLFEDAAIWDTVLKIKAAAHDPSATDQSYLEALGLVLAHEILRTGAARPVQIASTRGGLAPWQQRKIAAYIEENFAEPVTVATMADLVDLSTYYFCRAFKQSFGISPHRYLARRRIEHAKQLLIEHKQSITHIALEVGFDETSSFSAAFRKATGLTPTGYQRTAGQ